MSNRIRFTKQSNTRLKNQGDFMTEFEQLLQDVMPRKTVAACGRKIHYRQLVLLSIRRQARFARHKRKRRAGGFDGNKRHTGIRTRRKRQSRFRRRRETNTLQRHSALSRYRHKRHCPRLRSGQQIRI